MRELGTKHVNLDQKVYKQIKSLILSQNLKPGSKIYQEKLAANLGISRTPLVNALKMLEQENLITASPRRGFHVRRFSKEDLVSIFELREVLEGLVARRSALRISEKQIQKLRLFFNKYNILNINESVEKYAEEDRRFHSFLMNIGGDNVLSRLLNTYSVVSFSYFVGALGGIMRLPRETLPEHLAIIEAIADKDPEKAETTVRTHFKHTREHLVKNFKE